MARFNGNEHLEAFRDYGRFPKIHESLFNLIAETWQGGSFMDVCCSTGLLGQRIATKLGCPCVGVEGDADAIARGKAHGVTLSVRRLEIEPRTMSAFERILDDHKVNTLVARRCISELFAEGVHLGHTTVVQTALKEGFAETFVNALLRHNVDEVYLQGRAKHAGSRHVIPNLDAELEFFLPQYEVHVRRGECAYLRRVQPHENTDKKAI
jgi:hypothetical protein